MIQYRIIDINGNTHVIMADGYSISDKNNLVFWTNDIRFSDDDSLAYDSSAYLFARFNFDNIISITKYNVDKVEIEKMSDSMVEPTCKINVSPSTVEHNCSTCKHTNKLITAEPCMDCIHNNKWEAKYENN